MSNIFQSGHLEGTIKAEQTFNGSVSKTKLIKGEDGKSIAITDITESTEDGGNNIVTFSDGSVLTVKNGRAGASGKDGKTPEKSVDYFTEADKREIVDAVLSNFINASEVAM